MDKMELTEVGIKLIAFASLIKPVGALIGIVLNSPFAGKPHFPEFISALLLTLIPIVLAIVIIKKTDTILEQLYKK
jgi:hypothetical protein